MDSSSQRTLDTRHHKSDEKLDEAGDSYPDDHVLSTPSTVSNAEPRADDVDLEKNDPVPIDGGTQQRTPSDHGHHQPIPPGKDRAFLAKFEPGDKRNPKNWSNMLKGWITLQLGFLALVGSLGSSIIAPAENALGAEFGIGSEVTVLAVSLYVLGFAVGPMMWGPISEVYGRKWSMLPPVLCLGLFSIGAAVSKTPQAFFICRFFGGVFGSAPISNVSAALGDIYDAKARGVAMAFYSICVVGGPTLGPIIGSALTVNKHLGWRWTEYIEAIFAFFMAVLAFFAMPELYPPVLLHRRAQQLRRETGDERYWHYHEDVKITPKNVVTKYFSRPMIMLVTEPAVTFMACYASFVYGMLYLFLEVFPIVFAEWRGYGPVVSTLPFLGLFVGTVCAMVINIANQPIYMKAVEKNGGKAVPEARLPPMIIGGLLFVSGIFWFGWTAAPNILWVSPVIAAAFIGAGFNVLFQQALNYLVDTYGLYAASATSANTFLRSLFACGLPLAAGPMFHNMGVGAAASLLGGISCLALPIPIVFMKYGKYLRSKSKFAPFDD